MYWVSQLLEYLRYTLFVTLFVCLNSLLFRCYENMTVYERVWEETRVTPNCNWWQKIKSLFNDRCDTQIRYDVLEERLFRNFLFAGSIRMRAF